MLRADAEAVLNVLFARLGWLPVPDGEPHAKTIERNVLELAGQVAALREGIDEAIERLESPLASDGIGRREPTSWESYAASMLRRARTEP